MGVFETSSVEAPSMIYSDLFEFLSFFFLNISLLSCLYLICFRHCFHNYIVSFFHFLVSCFFHMVSPPPPTTPLSTFLSSHHIHPLHSSPTPRDIVKPVEVSNDGGPLGIHVVPFSGRDRR